METGEVFELIVKFRFADSVKKLVNEGRTLVADCQNRIGGEKGFD